MIELQGISFYILCLIIILFIPFIIFKMIAYLYKIRWISKLCDTFHLVALLWAITLYFWGNFFSTVIFIIGMIILILNFKIQIEERQKEQVQNYWSKKEVNCENKNDNDSLDKNI